MAKGSLIQTPQGDADFELRGSARTGWVVFGLLAGGIIGAILVGNIESRIGGVESGMAFAFTLFFFIALIPFYLLAVRFSGRETISIRSGMFRYRAYLLGMCYRERDIQVQVFTGPDFERYSRRSAHSGTSGAQLLAGLLASPMATLASFSGNEYGGRLVLRVGRKTIQFGHGLGEIRGPQLAAAIRERIATQGGGQGSQQR